VLDPGLLDGSQSAGTESFDRRDLREHYATVTGDLTPENARRMSSGSSMTSPATRDCRRRSRLSASASGGRRPCASSLRRRHGSHGMPRRSSARAGKEGSRAHLEEMLARVQAREHQQQPPP